MDQRLKTRLFHLIILIVISCKVNAVKLESETINFDMRAAAMHFVSITGHKGLDLTNSAIINDDKGYLWIGTQDGLVRLDGYQSKRFTASSKSNNSLVAGFVTSLMFEPLTKRIWVGTSSGLSVFDLQTERFTNYKYDEKITGSLSSNVVQKVFVDARSRIWIGTKNGLNLFQPKTNTFRHFFYQTDDQETISHNNILDIEEDKKGNLWFATQQGISLLKEGQKFERFYPFSNADGSKGLVTKIAIDKYSKLWLGTEKSGLINFNPKTKQSVQYLKKGPANSLPSNYIRSLLFDKDEQLWIGTSGGMTILNTQTDSFLNFRHIPELSGNVVALHQDKNDIVWIGTWSKGLHHFNSRETQVGKIDLEMLDINGDSLKSLLNGFGSDIWSANPKNLFKIQSNKNKIIKYDLLSINPTNVRAIPFKHTLKENIFLLVNKIYDITDTNNLIEYSLPEKIRNASWYSATIDSKGRLWLGSRSIGIYILSPDFKTIVHHIQSSIAGYIRQVDKQTMLVGSFSATYWINIDTFEKITHKPDTTNGMLNANVTGYHKTSNGEEWLATSGGIHQLLTNENNLQYYKTWTREDGLPTEVLTGPLEDSKGKLWFSSTDGLIRFTPKNNSIDQFDQGLGALSNYYIGQYLKDTDKRMLFQGPKGISIIDEEYIKTNDTKYDIVIDEFRLKDQLQTISGNNKSVLQQAIQYTSEISIPAESRDFTFSFSTTYITRTNKVRYFYRLVGFDKSWLKTDPSNRLLKYTNLDPGRYRFEIYSLSQEGVKGDILGIDLKISAYYYETIWFRTLIIALILSAFLVWYKYRMYKIKQQNKALEIEVEQRTQSVRTLADIGKDIGSLLDMKELIEHLYVHLNKSLDVSVLAVGIFEPKNNRIKFENCLEDGESMPVHYRPMDIKTQLAAWCIHHDKEMLLGEHADRYNFIDKNAGPVVGQGMQTVVYLPIRSRTDKMLGCLTVQSSKKDAYDYEALDFIRTISNYTGIALDNALAHSELKKASSTDYLTNLPNRRSFLEQSSYQIKVSDRSKSALTFAMADIDNFKLFNDVHGHECGDYVLQQVANVFREHVREQDIVARWGGEEFVFLFPNTNAAGAKIALNKVRVFLEESTFVFQEKELKVTSTFGLCLYTQGNDIDSVIDRADKALYIGKESGRNRVEVAESKTE
jgi:diguanylate cyclase (GGDEF)-like protein